MTHDSNLSADVGPGSSSSITGKTIEDIIFGEEYVPPTEESTVASSGDSTVGSLESQEREENIDIILPEQKIHSFMRTGAPDIVELSIVECYQNFDRIHPTCQKCHSNVIYNEICSQCPVAGASGSGLEP